MERLTKLSILALLMIFIAAAPACKQKAPEKKSDGKAADATPTAPSPSEPYDDEEDDEDDEEEVDPCENTSSDDEDEEDDEEDDFELRAKSASNDKKKSKSSKSKKRGLSLADSVTYEDIESIIDSKCLSCHDSGATSPALNTYSKVKSEASTIESEIDDGTMPPDGSTKLTSSEKTKIRNWIADGKLETADDAGSDEEEDDESSSDDDSSNCDEEEEEEEDDEPGFDKDAAFEELLNPKELKECHDDGKVYDRGKDKCHVSSIAKSYDCTVDGVVKKFKAANITTLKTSGGKLVGFEDYEIDQCGEYKGDPVIFFYKKVDTAENEIALSIKVLCKKDSPACAR